METFLYILFFISCIVLVVAVLLQPGKTDAGALFTSGVSNLNTNPRGTASVLAKLTVSTAVVFMLSALLLSLPGITGNISVLDSQGTTNNSPSTTPPANTNAQNANSANTSNTAANREVKQEEKKEGSKADDKKDDTKSEEKSADSASANEKKADKNTDRSDDKKEEK